MTQEERWMKQYDDVMGFLAEYHRRPSKYYLEERNIWNWMRHQQKLMGKGEMKEERVEMYKELMVLMEENKHVNQYK